MGGPVGTGSAAVLRCRVEGCDRSERLKRGLCNKHYKKFLRLKGRLVGTDSHPDCGTRTGYDHHILVGEDACDACREAVNRAARNWPSKKLGTPCDVCASIHQGVCVPDERRSVKVSVSLPRYVHDRMVREVPWGERSPWVVRQIRRGLGL